MQRSSLLQGSFSPPNRVSYSPLLRIVISLSIFILLVCVSGCDKNVLNSFGEMAQLRDDLRKEFHEQGIGVTLQDSTNLAVTFLNSPLNAQPRERFKRAQETALFIKRHYAGIDRLESILVRFLKGEKRMYVIDYVGEVDSFVFGKDAVLVGASPGDNNPQGFKDVGDATVNYNPARNESEVRITRLQLEGDTDKGVMVSPRFKVRGDASTAGHTIGIPSAIIFDFASFAPEKIFKGDPVLRIVADGNTIYNDKAHNLSTTTEGGNEFLVQAVPLDQFLKLTEAKTVVLALGNKEYLLTETQLHALRDMASYANAGRKR